MCQNLVPLVNIKIAGKWMFIPLKMVLIGIDPYPFPLFSVEGLPFSAEKPTLEPKKMGTQFQSGTPYLKKLMLEGAPHQVAKVVSISTNPQKAKTCQGGPESRPQRWHGKTRLSTMISGIKLTHISSCQKHFWANDLPRSNPRSGSLLIYGYGSKPWYLVNPKIAGKWMFIPLKMYL